MSWSYSNDPVLATLQDLVAVDSVNPALPGGGQGESGMVAYLCDFFHALDIPCDLCEVLPGRHNIIATLPARTPIAPCSSNAIWIPPRPRS